MAGRHPITGATGIEVCILAGGLSARMGRDKARLKLGSTTMLARIRAVAADAFGHANANFNRSAKSPVRLVRVQTIVKDRVRRCGPLGGILTALRTSKAKAILFLACDMPLISPALLRRLLRASQDGKLAVVASQNGRVGFPCLLPVTESLAVVEKQIAAHEFSVRALAKELSARPIVISARSSELFNVNSPEDLEVAEQLLVKKTRRLVSQP